MRNLSSSMVAHAQALPHAYEYSGSWICVWLAHRFRNKQLYNKSMNQWHRAKTNSLTDAWGLGDLFSEGCMNHPTLTYNPYVPPFIWFPYPLSLPGALAFSWQQSPSPFLLYLLVFRGGDLSSYYSYTYRWHPFPHCNSLHRFGGGIPISLHSYPLWGALLSS